MEAPAAPRHSIRNAIFLDIPYILDSACRHSEYALNRLHRYAAPAAGAAQPPVPRPYSALPPFVLFLGVLLYAAYGPTFTALCGVMGAHLFEWLRSAAAWACIAGALVQWGVTEKYFIGRIRKRFRKQQITDRRRLICVHGVVALGLVACALPLAGLGWALLDDDAFEVCHPGTPVGSTWIQLGALLAAAGLAWLFARRTQSVRGRILWQTCLLAALVALLWNLPGIPTRSEAGQAPYPHLYAVVALALAIVAWLATWLIAIPFNSMTDAECAPFQHALRERELFAESRHDPDISKRRIFGGCVIGILREPLLFLLIPAFAIILVPTGFLWHACVFGILASAVLTTAGNLTSRWDQTLQYMRRYFLLGTPLIATVTIVAIAAMRLANVQYVATVLNVAPFGVLFVWMVLAYVLFWWFEYQVNSVLAAELLKVFDPRATGDAAIIDYKPGEAFESTASRVECAGRYLTAHATGEFAAVGWFRDHESQKPTLAFQTFGFLGLMEMLLGRERPDAVHELGRRVQLYFALVNSLLVVALIALLVHHGWGDRHNTVASVVSAQTGNDVTGSADLVSILLDHGRRNEPAIVIAASGGGTRAALYTANVLQGLHALGADKHIVLLSGVSGGGVAAAYFYSHRQSLLSNTRQPCDQPGETVDPWSCFLKRMTAPFIRDVLEGAGEWRVQSTAPLGVLLAESFERRLFADGKALLGDDSQLGIILNTTVTGHPQADEPELASAFRARNLAGVKCDALDHPLSGLAGGRLAFTNIRNVSAFQKTRADLSNVQLPFVLVRDGAVPLARAAALNANFPPVFPNARVSLSGYAPDASGCITRSYFVTDGGATENLGLVSALLALRSALADPRMTGALPEIHIVLAEASATDYDYHQDRGLGAATGGSKERLVGRLTLELLDQVETAAHAAGGRIVVHDLALPRVFRSRGGFGTHWMFPQSVRVMNPQIFSLPARWRQVAAQYTRRERYWVTLSKPEMFELWQDLYDRDRPFCERRWPAADDPAQDLSTVSGWICGRTTDGAHPLAADGQPGAWIGLKQSLSSQRTD